MNATFDDITREILSSPPPARGRRTASLMWGSPRALEESDIEALHSPTRAVVTTPGLQQIRQRHHFIARLIAEGRKNIQISEIAGISQSRISILLQDPAFKELVAYYKEQIDGQFLDVHARLAMLGVTAIEELQERLDSKPESFVNKELRELVETTMDRSAAPSKAGGGSPTVVTVRFVEATAPQKTIEGTATEVELDTGDEIFDAEEI